MESQTIAKSKKTEIKTAHKGILWSTLIISIIGLLIYLFGLISELNRIREDLMEDGIILGFLYFLLTFLGAIRSVSPNLPKILHQLSAFANVSAGSVVIMLWVGLFNGALDSDAWFVPLLLTPLYILILKGIRVDEFFRFRSEFTIIIVLLTIGAFYLENRILFIVTFIVWIVFLFYGFHEAKGDKVSSSILTLPKVISCPICGEELDLDEQEKMPTCPKCKNLINLS